MTTRMLIDARHREETRVAVLTGNRIEEFDFESAERKQLKGNIYLAKVTRVEPSLQAAFVEFGGNRHGFLAFSEIHPDYYQIPKEDREALLRAEAEEARLMAEEQDAEDEAEEAEYGAGEHDIDGESIERLDTDGGPELLDAAADHPHEDGEHADHDHGDHDHAEEGGEDDKPRANSKPAGNGEGDQVEALRRRRQNLRRHYKIQDVIHRRQVLLVQVVKEERGNKGAALTTYMSLAGRYCVLMPNTSHGGGISRKISNAADRKRLKSIMADMKLPKTMGCIVRTAGLSRSKTEIKRDFDYLARLWDGIRENTLASSAPALIYEDSNLVKRAIRDLYTREIDEVIVEGADGYHGAREYMKLLMPSHAKKIRPYADAVPLFQRFGAEDQLSAMYQPLVQLKSGGYLVINPTEALVSIDINSGRSTREHNIEQTATATNLEAAHEIARQLRLRDMAGLVVIDFIDMENNSNVRKVEKAMKEALKNDRARIQVGRISSFGLMEMSRQRLRTGVLEASTRICPHCEGSGFVRTASSAGLSALRLLEETAARGRGSLLSLRASREAAIYVLNRKRAEISEIEDRYGVQIEVLLDGHDDGARMAIDVAGPPPAYAPRIEPIPEPEDFDEDIEDEEDEDAPEERDEAEARPPRREREAREREEGDVEGESEGERTRRRRRRRRRGGRREEGRETVEGEGVAPEGEEAAEDEAEEGSVEQPVSVGDDEDAQREGGRRRRRGRRGGRRREGVGVGEGSGEAGEALIIEAGDTGPVATDLAGDGPIEAPETAPVEASTVTLDPEAEAPAEPSKPKARRRPRARAGDAAPAETVVEAEAAEAPAPVAAEEGAVEAAPAKPKRTRRKAAPVEDIAAEAAVEPGIEAVVEVATPAIETPAVEEEAPKPRRGRRAKAASADAAPAVEETAASAAETQAAEPVANDEAAAEAGPPRRGWWQRTFGA